MKIFKFSQATLFLIFWVNSSKCVAPFLSVVLNVIYSASSTVTIGEFIGRLDSKKSRSDLSNYNIHEEIRLKNHHLETILSDLPQQVVFLQNLQIFEDKIRDIDSFYKDLVRYEKTYETLSSDAHSEMKKFLYRILLYSQQGPVKFIIDVMEIMALGPLNALDRLRKKSFEYSSTCSTDLHKKSLQSTFHEYLGMIVLAEVKVFLMLNITSNILNRSDPSNKNNTLLTYDEISNTLLSNHKKMLNKFKIVLSDTSRDVWRCDPESFDYKEGEAFVKLKHVFRGHVANERDINDSNELTCSSSCGAVNPTREYSCKVVQERIKFFIKPTTENSLCLHHRMCTGSLWNCYEAFGKWTSSLKICLSNRKSERNYEFVESYTALASTKRHGSRDTCKGALIPEFPRRSGIFNHCFSCYCICDDGEISDYTFSRQKSKWEIRSERMFYKNTIKADVLNNYVITGARFQKHEGLIYIQIQQGVLLGNGLINKTTVHWKTEPADLLMNRDNHIRLDWTARGIELQDIDVPPEHVLVGVRIEMGASNGVDRLRLTAMSHSFDFNSGELALKEDWFYYNEKSLSRSGFDTYNLKLPDKSFRNQIIVTNQYLNFSISNFDSDIGQTTVPLIDIQDVTTSKPYPMGGIGIYYRRSTDDSVAGFIGLKLKTYNFY